mmetsp:Transcript_36232/g.69467  ORF Transcript_36232/g.69467 Transcript_36232/m.69467 type:complete len:215 (-) Transcript_36232:258-902(-)
MRLYCSTVAATSDGHSSWISLANLRSSVAPRIISKMRRTEPSDMSAKAMKLKWRSMRLDTGLRPPPGGPMQPMYWMSISLRNAHGGLRSNQPLWSIHWRRISIGGWAKYFSRWGMFMSSREMIIFLPEGGPNTPLRRLSILESIRSCVWLAEVRAEKVMKTGVMSAGRSLFSLSCTVTVLPVPVSPTHRMCFPLRTSLSITKVYEMVSEVGTMI